MLLSCTIIAILLLFATHTEAQERVEAQYLEETELVSIVAHLAKVNGYDWDAKDVGVDDYLAEVDSVFVPFRSHPIVSYIRKELHGEGFNWHFPMHIALRLHIADGKITYDVDLEKNFDDYYDRITPENEKTFIQLLQDFYDTSRFHEFYTQHRAIYRECETAMQHVLNQVDFSWYDSFFGPREGNTFHVYANILIGPANYAVHQKRQDGSEIINAVMGCCYRNRQGEISYDTYSTLPIIVHECNHSYCNPLNEAFWPQLCEKMEAFFATNAQHYADEAYGDPVLVLNETFVEACVMRYLMSHPFDFSENTNRWIEMLGIDKEQLSAAPDRIKYIQDAYLRLLTDIDYEQKRFYMIKDVIEALAEREQQTFKYPTMHDFMPRYIEVVNAYNMIK